MGPSHKIGGNEEKNPYIINVPCTPEEEPSPDGLGWDYFRAMKKYSKNVAQYMVETDESDTYSNLLSRITRVAIHLQEKHKIDKDTIIGICTNHSINSIVPYIAGFFLGVPIVVLDHNTPQKDMVHLLQRVTPTIMFAQESVLEILQAAIGLAKVKIDLISYDKNLLNLPTLEEYLVPTEKENSFEPVKIKSNKETAIIFYSSGTTGLPKGICAPHYSIAFHGMYMKNHVMTGNITQSYTTLYWISAALVLSATVFSGATRIVASKYVPENALKIVDKYKVSFMFLAPYNCIQMAKHGIPKGVDTSSLKTLITGGSSMSPTHFKLVQDLLPNTNFSQGYGQTEIAGFASMFKNYPEDQKLLKKNPGSVGLFTSNASYKIVDVESEEILGPNKKGELRIKTPTVMNGYYNLDSNDCFDSDGFLKTGDVCYYDEDKCLYVVDRIKELIKFRSNHVPPAILENVLHSHPAVYRAVVIGLPHLEDGEHSAGFIILKEGVQNVKEKDILEYANEKVSDFQKLRGGIRFVKEIPLTITGKVKRQTLKAMAIAERKI